MLRRQPSVKPEERTSRLSHPFRYFISISIFIGLMGFLPVGNQLINAPEAALAVSDPVIAAAGDIACDPTSSSFNGGNGSAEVCRQKYTSDLLLNMDLAAVLALGDIQYYCGGYQAFLQSYNLSWGRVKAITRPVVGNHEYLTSGGTDCTIANEGATGYFNYFGAAAGSPGQGYYSYDVGNWHLIALNSNCTDAGGCGPTSPQGQWLAADLVAHSNFCTLAYWHIPLFSSGGRDENNSRGLWQTLYDYDADVILNGHDHIYERFAPQAPDGTLDLVRGIREFIVGSGGSNHTGLAQIAANSEVRNTNTYGVLKLTLHQTSYDWEFVPEAGKTFTDSGTGMCHGILSPLTSTPTPARTRTPTPTATATIRPSSIFTDVPAGFWAEPYIRTLYQAGITGGCGNGNYCPSAPVTRAQMAVFLLRGRHGSNYVPPAARGNVFGDVEEGYWAAAWIERLAIEGITSGCGNNNFCPDAAVTRDQMAIFLLRAKHGSSYVPPAATGNIFVDVPASYWAARWIERLAAEGITSGCGNSTYCPAQIVTRDQMAVFLVRTFDLP
jgi:acid phosphatase type 7